MTKRVSKSEGLVKHPIVETLRRPWLVGQVSGCPVVRRNSGHGFGTEKIPSLLRT